jgi:23S rRNA (cytidine1920-2'-O)/16S rRNA (cytidine1409-2'-O)-methyltransferase
MRRRLDIELLRRGLAPSRSAAQTAIAAGLVTVDGAVASTPARLVSPAQSLHLRGPARRFVSRGGEKLDAALTEFSISVAGANCLDVGASTGGFTDCLLRREANSVVALDVGHGQLDWRIRNHERVTCLEKTNFRTCEISALGGPFDVVVADVSFISLRLLVAQFAAVLKSSGDLIVLVKPQFEVGRQFVGPKGIVHDRDARERCLSDVTQAFAHGGLPFGATMESPITGTDGNVEYLAWARAANGPE